MVTVAPELVVALVRRAARPDFAAFEAQLRSSGYCARPVRLAGRVEVCEGGGRRGVWSTDAEPDGILRKACGNRREAVCPPCAERYRGDAYQLVIAGLRGGKGVPDTVAEHPAVFVTLTAPSFGAVHTRGTRPDGRPRRCRPRHDAPVCVHGVRLSCGRVHDEDDPCLGEPICPDCFDHQAAVVWNNALSELWRRTTIYLPRVLARLTGQTQKRLRERVRISYVKVAEYQRRGLVHLHAVIRLDRAMPAYRATEIHPPPAPFGVELLEDAIRATVREVAAPLPDRLDAGEVRWGQELDIRRLDDEARRSSPVTWPSTRPRAPNWPAACFIASASTRSTRSACANTYAATCAPRSRSPPSPRSLIGASPPCAHQLGYRGHCLTKSRRYSTTFTALRNAREQHVHEQLAARSTDSAQLALASAAVRITSFRCAGQGHITAADELLAASAAARARDQRRAAREALADHPLTRKVIRCETPQR